MSALRSTRAMMFVALLMYPASWLPLQIVAECVFMSRYEKPNFSSWLPPMPWKK